MGGFHFYCSVSGSSELDSREAFLQELAEIREEEDRFNEWLEKTDVDNDLGEEEEAEEEEEGDDDDGDSDNDDESDNDNEESAEENDEDEDQVEDEDEVEVEDDEESETKTEDNEEVDSLAGGSVYEGANDEKEAESDEELDDGSVDPELDEAKYEGKFPSEEILEGLLFSKGDVKASRDYMMIAGYTPNEKGELGILHCQAEGDKVIGENDPATVVFNVRREEDSEGDFTLADDPSVNYDLWIESGAFLITFNAYCILQTVAPELTPSLLYRVFTRNTSEDDEARGVIHHIKYGPVRKTFGQYVQRTEICSSQHPGLWWMKLLCDKERTRDEILYEAWRGRGNLWGFVRPDKFPISEALSSPSLMAIEVKKEVTTHKLVPAFVSLPLDILFLICETLSVKSFLHVLFLNKQTRAKLLPHADSLSYKAMKNLEPYYFPALPIKTPDGKREREELESWETGWRDGGFSIDTLRQKAPWLKYRLQCSRSPSMRNRKRIWGISAQIKAVAQQQGILDEPEA